MICLGLAYRAMGTSAPTLPNRESNGDALPRFPCSAARRGTCSTTSTPTRRFRRTPLEWPSYAGIPTSTRRRSSWRTSMAAESAGWQPRCRRNSSRLASVSGRPIVVARRTVDRHADGGQQRRSRRDRRRGRWLDSQARTKKWYNVRRAGWLADSSAVLAAAAENTGAYLQHQVWAIPLSGAPPRKITSDLNNYAGMSTTSAGDAFVAVQLSGTAAVWVARRAATHLARRPLPAEAPRWTAQRVSRGRQMAG